ncbi:uncharacterized protein LOC106408015 [Brassica napus]|uniref:uncharacterized protein LOC106408015 n=1 Tax=Brassica napus TaxID=3708 RepID=UPI0006AA9539|nr:uncharacterized protein LOC106408015 [Brassica napus]
MEVYIDDMRVKSLEADDHISHLQKAFSTLRKYNMKLNLAKCSFGLVLHKPKVLGRLAKWAVELGEYDVIFLPATAIKSQVLADFVAEFSPALLPALEQDVRLRGETKKEGEWILHVDGSSNVRGAGVGIMLTSPTGNTASRAVRCNFKVTNNESEYEALIAGLTLAHQMGAENIQVFGDSQLIINLVQGEYQAKDDSMIQYLTVAQRLIKKFKSCKLTQIPREQNSQADTLANLGSTLETNSQMSIPLLVLQWPGTLEEPPSEEVSAVEEGETWMNPLVRYLEADILPEDRNEARKIKKQAARYCISQEKLYRRSFSGPYLSGRTLVLRARRASSYWPTIAADAEQQAKHYDQCQRHAPVSKLPPENLKSISSPWPLRKWGMDIVGKFPMAPGQKVFLLIVTDYFSKWVEAEALSRITDLQIRKFLWTYVITRFEVPHEIVNDNGPQFTSHNFKEFCKDWGIKITFATPRHPQSNGQAEPTSKTVWAEELHGVLWACRTTRKTSTGETTYSLVYGSEAIVPTVMHVRTTVSRSTSQEENNELMAQSLDLLDKKGEAARLRNLPYQQDVARTYNKKVRTRTFQQGNWVI